MKKVVFAILIWVPFIGNAQFKIKASHDTLFMQGDSVVVSATRTERKLSNVTVPVTLLNAAQIKQSGSLRLTDILKEQSGITFTSGFGSGVQLQGLNPDYTIILINGEPLVGRTSGVLDLNRISLDNVKKIEIVKGPSSSLYGSEAMAGVINIITDQSAAPLELSMRYGTYNSLDASLKNGLYSKNFTYNGFYNSYSTNGYSIRPNTSSRVTTPIERYATQQRFSYDFNKKWNLLVNARYTEEHIKSNIDVANNGSSINSTGTELNKDVNLNSTLNFRWNDQFKSSTRAYLTNYISNQELVTLSGLPYTDLLNHLYKRFENQTDWYLSKHYLTTIGLGAVWEGVKSTRYDSEKVRKTNTTQYVFFQNEWRPNDKFIGIWGVRFDNNEKYSSAWSPKASFQYRLNNKHNFKFSAGQGFKAPDFRQLYLDFTNNAAGGYSVFGTVQAQQTISALNTLGQIGGLFDSYYQIKTLKPEYSTGIHFTWEYTPVKATLISLQLYRNDINNLIQVQQVAAYASGAQIFSYLNVGRAYTTGAEIEVSNKINSHWNVSAGYQFLKTGDKDQEAMIRSGKVYIRDANGYSRKLSMSDYVGLPNNSTHKAQLKVNYNSDHGFFWNARAIYRSKWAVNNNNGNEVYDNGDVFADGYVSLHTALGKQINKSLSYQLGCDNIGNHIDGANLPNLPGRTFFALIQFKLNNK